MPRLALAAVLALSVSLTACEQEIAAPQTFGSSEGRIVICRGVMCVDVANGTQVNATKPGAAPLSVVLVNREVFRFDHIPTGEWTLMAESSAAELESGCWITYEPRTVIVRELETTETVINGTFGC